MIALLLYPLNLLVYALRYWPIPTILAIGAIVAGVITIAVTTGGTRHLTLPEYQRWCDDLATQWAISLLNARSSDDLIDGLDFLNDETDEVRPPDRYIPQYDSFIQEIESSKQEVESIATLIDVAAAVGSFLADVSDVLGWNVRQEVMADLSEDGNVSAQEIFGSTCGISNIEQELRERNESAAQADATRVQPKPATNQDSPDSSTRLNPDPSQHQTAASASSGDETHTNLASQPRQELSTVDSANDRRSDGVTASEAEADGNSNYDSSDSDSCDPTSWDLGLLQFFDNYDPQAANDGPRALTVGTGGTIQEKAKCRSEHTYTFELNDSYVLTVSLDSDDFDPYLALRDRPAQQLLSDNHDFDDCCNARIVTTLDSGRYLVIVRSFGGLTGGRYTLRIELDEPPTPATAGSDDTISATEDFVANDQFIGDHGGFRNHSFGSDLPLLARSLTDRQIEVQLGRWFHKRLFQFGDEEVDRDAYWGLIGYNYYNSNWPSSVCRDEDGDPLSYGWDAQPYEATPAGIGDATDWRTRSWHPVYSVVHGHVAFVDEQLGDIGIFDGWNTIYYKHLNEVSWDIVPDGLIDGETGMTGQGDWVEVFPGDYLGRMGMRGTAIAPHLTIEVRAGPPPHELCPPEGTATSPLPYLYRLLGGR